MKDVHCLSQLRPGQQARVTGLVIAGPMRRRLQDLGFVPGAAVSCVGASPWGGPAAYQVRGAVIALRQKDAGAVQLENISE